MMEEDFVSREAFNIYVSQQARAGLIASGFTEKDFENINNQEKKAERQKQIRFNQLNRAVAEAKLELEHYEMLMRQCKYSIFGGGVSLGAGIASTVVNVNIWVSISLMTLGTLILLLSVARLFVMNTPGEFGRERYNSNNCLRKTVYAANTELEDFLLN